MAGAKPLLMGAVLALACASAALADNPTVRISKADQAKAEQALLRLHDFGVGWKGGATSPSKLTAPNCPGFNPKESDLVVTGHAEARFSYSRGGVIFDQDTQVLETAQAVATDFARTIQPKLSDCLARQLKASGKGTVVSVDVKPLDFPHVGSVSAAYRASIVVRSHGRLGKIVSDFVFFGQGRFEFSLNVVAPAFEGGQLIPFEQAMVEKLVSRAATGNVA
jgi:hypothetical protein